MSVLVETQNVVKIFQEGVVVPVTALNGISIQIEEGGFVAFSGPSGSGKTTLANVLIGIPKYKISSGKILFNKKNINNNSDWVLLNKAKRCVLNGKC
ncbi:ATP-binding cassette domain-containing protein [candidate division KSB1 bacterium]|nr:ATP-binding cassette domain-containing protein [candidate division KSB1 bacterium]